MTLLALILACTPDKAAPDDSAPADDSAPVDDSGADDSAPDPDSGDSADSGDSGEVVEPDPDWGVGVFMAERLVGHPRVVALPEDLEALVARVTGAAAGDERAQVAWATLYANIEATCASTPPTISATDFSPGSVWWAAAIARDCAFVAWIEGDQDAADKASGVLLGLPTDAREIDDPTSDVHLSTGLGLAVQAWDLLAGSSLDVDLDATRAPVVALADSYYTWFVEENFYYLLVWRNNHNLKFAAALGQAALVFNDEPAAWDWAAYAQTEIPAVLGEQSTEDGGYDEGPYYYMYGMHQPLAYLRAWHRLLGDTDGAYPVNCNTRLDCEDGTWERPGDVWTSDLVRAGLDWSVGIAMPDGMRPPIDDGVPAGFPSLVAAELDPSFAGDWLAQSDPVLGWAGDLSAEQLAAFDGTWTAPVRPDCAFYPAAGMAVLREGEGAEATWAMLLAESGVNTYGGGHEHPDEGSFQLYARGSYLAIDTGYASYTERDATDDYDDHNVILVDGEDPPSTVSGELTVELGGEDCAPQATLSWEGVSWTRGVTLEQGALVVRDVLDLEGTHELAWRLHTQNGGDRGSLEITEWGAVLRQDGVSLTIVLAGPVEPSLSTETGQDALTYGTIEEHEVLIAGWEATGEARMLAVLLPGEEDAEAVVTRSVDGVTIDGVSWSAE